MEVPLDVAMVKAGESGLPHGMKLASSWVGIDKQCLNFRSTRLRWIPTG